MSQTRGMAYLRRKLELKRSRVLTRYKYYEMKNAVKDFGMVTPPEFRTFSEVLGWCGKAVDSLADRSFPGVPAGQLRPEQHLSPEQCRHPFRQRCPFGPYLELFVPVHLRR